MKVLRMFFRYGLNISEGKALCSSTWQEDLKDSMRTLCLDFDGLDELAEPVQTNGENVPCMSDKAEITSSKFSFDTVYENNVIDLPNNKDAFLYESTEVRLCSISIIQVGQNFTIC